MNSLLLALRQLWLYVLEWQRCSCSEDRQRKLVQLSTSGFLGLAQLMSKACKAEAKVIRSLVKAGCLRSIINVVLVHPQHFQALETTAVRATTTADGGSTVTNSKRETKFSGTYYPPYCSPQLSLTPLQPRQRPHQNNNHEAVFTAALNTPHTNAEFSRPELHGHPTGHDLPLHFWLLTPSTSAGMQNVDTLPPAASDTPEFHRYIHLTSTRIFP